MAVDVTGLFRDAVRRRRDLLGHKTPAAEVLPRARLRSPFDEEAHGALEAIHTAATFLNETHAAYMTDDALHGMTEAIKIAHEAGPIFDPSLAKTSKSMLETTIEAVTLTYVMFSITKSIEPQKNLVKRKGDSEALRASARRKLRDKWQFPVSIEQKFTELLKQPE